MKTSTHAAQVLSWVAAGLLLVPGTGLASGLGDTSTCQTEPATQQRGGHSQAGAPKPDKPGEKPPERTKWWIDAKRRAEFGITDQQSAAVEQVWQKSSPSLREMRERLTKLEEVLSKLTEGSDEAAVIAQSESVEKLRAELNKGRTLMIYRMDRLLTPDQRAKVKAMYERREPPRRGSSLR